LRKFIAIENLVKFGLHDKWISIKDFDKSINVSRAVWPKDEVKGAVPLANPSAPDGFGAAV